MSQLTWVGRLLGNRFPFAASRPFRRPLATTKLGLNHLPGRDGPSLLSGVEVNLLSGLSAGMAIAGATGSIESNVAGVQSFVGKTNRLSSGEVTDFEFQPTLDTPASSSGGDANNDPLPTSVSLETTSASDSVRFTSFGSNVSDQTRSVEGISHSAGSVSQNSMGAVDRSMAQSGFANPASSASFMPTSPRIESAKTSIATTTITPKTSAMTFGPDAKASFTAAGVQAANPLSRQETSEPDVSNPVSETGLSETMDPGIVTETPPTFVDGQEAIGGLKLTESEAPPDNSTPSVTTGETPSVVTPGETSGHTPNHTIESGSITPQTSANADVTPRSDTVGRPLAANSELFRISGSPEAGSSLEVRYTLAAHDATGTVSVEGSVTVASSSVPAIITAGSALSGRSPEIITIQLKDMAGVRLVKSTGTLFLTPAGERVGDSALFEAHRMGKSHEAFEQLVQRHSSAVLRASQRIMGNRADAEDVTQFVFLTLAQWQLRFPGTLTGWLHTVARNASYALLRSKSRRQRHEREAAKPELSEPADSPSMVDDGLDSALSQLPAPLEEAVRLRYLEGWSQQEAAQIVGCPRGTLSRRAAHGIETLRELLGAELAAVG